MTEHYADRLEREVSEMKQEMPVIEKIQAVIKKSESISSFEDYHKQEREHTLVKGIYEILKSL